MSGPGWKRPSWMPSSRWAASLAWKWSTKAGVKAVAGPRRVHSLAMAMTAWLTSS